MLIGSQKIADFPPLSQQEFTMMTGQIQQHLSKGIPPNAPVQGLPMDALCRILKTIMVLGQQSEQALMVFKEVFEILEVDKPKHLAVKQKIAPFVLNTDDLSTFFEKYPLLIPEVIQIDESQIS